MIIEVCPLTMKLSTKYLKIRFSYFNYFQIPKHANFGRCWLIFETVNKYSMSFWYFGKQRKYITK